MKEEKYAQQFLRPWFVCDDGQIGSRNENHEEIIACEAILFSDEPSCASTVVNDPTIPLSPVFLCFRGYINEH